MRSTSARACSGSEASTSRSTTRPTRAPVDAEPEVLERVLDCLALRIEDARLRPDEDRRLHLSTRDGSAA